MAEPENVTNNDYDSGIYLFRLDNHYDSVFEKNFIQDAAFCQSIVYDMLYKKVFKLPDVRFAVSRMLHESPIENKSHIEFFSKQNVEKRKKIMERDHDWFNAEEEASPSNTSCILDALTKCMFHNLDNKNGNELSRSNCEMDIESDDDDIEDEEQNIFIKNAEDKYNGNYNANFTNYYEEKNLNHADNLDLKNTYKTIITNYFNDNDTNNINEQTEHDLNENNNNEDNSFNNNGFPDFVAKLFDLTDFCANDPNISCVKQMLNENLTPFPYKVAKALDPDIYRNIEFDTWNEIRREQRYGTWYNGGTALQVGVKCLVKLTDCQATWYHCHIQEMSSDKRGAPCLVFVEELGEKKTVPREFLQPLPLGQAKPWALPYRHYRNLASSLQGNRLLTLADYGSAKLKKTRVYKTRKEKDSLNNDKSKRYSQTRGLKTGSNEKLSITSDSNGNDLDFINHPLHALTSTYQTYAENRVDIVAMPVSVVLDNQNQQSNEGGQSLQLKPPNNDSTNESVFSNQPITYSNESNIQTPVTNVNNMGYMYQYNPYSANYNSTVAYPNSPSYSTASISYTQTYSNSPTTYTNSGSYPTSTVHEQSVTPPSVDNYNQNYSLGAQIGPVPSFGNVGQNYGYVVPPGPQLTGVPAPHNIRDLNNRSQYPINFLVQKSIYANGADLPYGDIATLRFFFNLGLESFRMSCVLYPQYGQDPSTGLAADDNAMSIHPQTTVPNIDQLAMDFQSQLKTTETSAPEGNTSNASTTNAKDNKRGTLGPRFKKNEDKNSGKSRHSHNNNNKSISSNLSSNLSENNDQPVSSSPIPPRGSPNLPTLTEPPPQPYLMSYAPVPGMYGPAMVPCYPVDAESANNYYVAPYMGMPYNVLPQPCENAVESYTVPEPHTYTPMMYQQPNVTTAGAVTTANTGYYQNPMWYQAPASSYMFSSPMATTPSTVTGYNNNGQISNPNYGQIIPPPQNQSFMSNNSNISQ